MMKILVRLLGFVLSVSVTLLANGQDRGTTITVSFDDVVTFEPTNGVDQSVFAVPARRVQEERSRKFTVTDFKVMKRTRTAVIDGVQVEQEYDVKVPFTRQVTQKYTVQARPRKVLRVSEIQAWNRNGEKVEAAELAEQLEAPAAGFLLIEPWPQGAKIEKTQFAVLRPDVLLVHVPSLTKVYRDEAKRMQIEQNLIQLKIERTKQAQSGTKQPIDKALDSEIEVLEAQLIEHVKESGDHKK